MMAWMKWCALGSALAVVPTTVKTPAAKVTPATEVALPRPDYLPPALREVLRRRMVDHGRDMHELVFAVVLLHREVAKMAARRIASEPKIARPTPGGEDDLNAALPERFFLLQDELKVNASKLADAASGKDDKQLASALGRMTETCVSCHAAYLEGGKP